MICEETIKHICDEKGIKLSVSESLTSGLLQDALSSVSGSSSYFQGGLTAYNIDQKVNLLGVDREHADSVNCVSERVAQEMSLGCGELFDSDVSIGITGYAEPFGDITTPFCYYSISYKGEILESGMFEVLLKHEGRNYNRSFFTSLLLEKLVTNLKNI